jgi:serine/threonine protein kinase/CBS domain-containing protein
MYRRDDDTSLIQEALEEFTDDGMLSHLAVDSRFHLIAEFDEDYEWTNTEVGRGAAGPVRLCQRSINGTLGPVRCAKRLKKFSQVGRDDEEVEEEVKNECMIHLTLDHPNIARLLDVYEDNRNVMLVSEYCIGGSLEDKILTDLRQGNSLSELHCQKLTLQLLLAIRYLHGKHICHRDVKPSNLLLSTEDVDTATLKLIDFGFSSTCPNIDTGDMLRSCVGTIEYTAPEVVGSGEDPGVCYSEQCDNWSIGVTACYMLTGKKPFVTKPGTYMDMVEVLLEAYKSESIELNEEMLSGLSSNAADFVRHLLLVSEFKRPSAEKALNHAWVAGELTNRGQADLDQQGMGVRVLSYFRAFAVASRMMRSSLQTMCYSKPSHELKQMERLFGIFDQKCLGEVDAEDFKTGLQKLGVELDKQAREKIFKQLQTDAASDKSTDSDGKTLKYSEVAAALVPMMLTASDSFGRQVSRPVAHSSQSPTVLELDAFQSVNVGLVPDAGYPKTDNGNTQGHHLDLDTPMKLLEMELPSRGEVMDGNRTVFEVLTQSKDQYRSAVLQMDATDQADQNLAFFDLMDVNRLLLSKIPDGAEAAPDQLQKALDEVTKTSARDVSSSSKIPFAMVDADCPLRDACAKIVDRSKDSLPRTMHIRRVPFKSSNNKLAGVLNPGDILQMALKVPEWAQVLKEQQTNFFEKRSQIANLCVPHDDTMLMALRKMESLDFKICPVINTELSGTDAEGAVAVGVLSIADLKHIIINGDAKKLSMSVLEFIAWRNTKMPEDAEKNRFPYVRENKACSLHFLAETILAVDLPRIFLSTEKLSRVIGMVSARDILQQAWPKLSAVTVSQNTLLSTGSSTSSAPNEPDSPGAKFAPGESVVVYSATQWEWIDASIVEVAKEQSVRDGRMVHQGDVKVKYTDSKSERWIKFEYVAEKIMKGLPTISED